MVRLGVEQTILFNHSRDPYFTSDYTGCNIRCVLSVNWKVFISTLDWKRHSTPSNVLARLRSKVLAYTGLDLLYMLDWEECRWFVSFFWWEGGGDRETSLNPEDLISHQDLRKSLSYTGCWECVEPSFYLLSG